MISVDLHEQAEAPQATPERKPYTRPVLERHGDVRDITLGTSPSPQESGPFGYMNRRPGG